jgi:DNA-binding transcriptional ArsR family regulator
MLNYQLDPVFRALADPTRRAIIERLTAGDATVSELARPLDMSLPAVMQHVQLLEDSGLVRTRKSGRVRTCRVESAALRAAESWLAERRTLWARRLDRLATVLAEQQKGSRK